MANTRTETFGAGDPDGDLGHIPRGSANPNSDYGQNRHKVIAPAPTAPAHGYEKPKPGRSNWDPMARPADAQRGLSDTDIAEQDAIMKEGAAAARRQLGDAAVPTVVEQPTLFE